MTLIAGIPQPGQPVERAIRLDASVGTLFIVACLTLIGGLMLLVILRRMMRPPPSGPEGKKPTPTSSPWEQSAKRMPMPETDIKEEP